MIRSLNSQGAFSETTPIALSAVPAPASGVMVNITYINPAFNLLMQHGEGVTGYKLYREARVSMMLARM
jgi:hypothetical protein